MPALYEELCVAARACLRGCGLQPAPDPAAILHEAYLRLAPQGPVWQGRAHFCASIVRVMRFALVEEARARAAQKRGGLFRRLRFDDLATGALETSAQAVDLAAMLARLADEDPRKACIVRLRYYVGLSVAQTADQLGLSPGTVRRQWYETRDWFQTALREQVG